MDRFGFAIMSTKKETISNALKWDFDYVVFQNDLFMNETFLDYPEIIQSLLKIGDNCKISVCKRIKEDRKKTLFGFLGLIMYLKTLSNLD
jgi:hypothetical protein